MLSLWASITFVDWNRAQMTGTPVMSGACAKPCNAVIWNLSNGVPPDSYAVSSGSAEAGFSAAAADANELEMLFAILSHTS